MFCLERFYLRLKTNIFFYGGCSPNMKTYLNREHNYRNMRTYLNVCQHDISLNLDQFTSTGNVTKLINN